MATQVINIGGLGEESQEVLYYKSKYFFKKTWVDTRYFLSEPYTTVQFFGGAEIQIS